MKNNNRFHSTGPLSIPGYSYLVPHTFQTSKMVGRQGKEPTNIFQNSSFQPVTTTNLQAKWSTKRTYGGKKKVVNIFVFGKKKID